MASALVLLHLVAAAEGNVFCVAGDNARVVGHFTGMLFAMHAMVIVIESSKRNATQRNCID